MYRSIPAEFSNLATILLASLIIAVVLLLIWWRASRRIIDRLMKRFTRDGAANQCRCGYAMTNLDRARCPECGRVLNFDATAEEIGLTVEQLERAQEKRRERDAASDADAERSV